MALNKLRDPQEVYVSLAGGLIPTFRFYLFILYPVSLKIERTSITIINNLYHRLLLIAIALISVCLP